MANSLSTTGPDRAETHPGSDHWLTLTDLGRLFGLSAVACGRLLSQAGLREPGGRPTSHALHRGLAKLRPGGHRGSTALWQRSGCRAALETHGLVPPARRTLVEQWAELLWTLKQGSPSISTSAEQMAEDLPRDLVEPVNRQLEQNGWDFRVLRHRNSGLASGQAIRNRSTGKPPQRRRRSPVSDQRPPA